MTWKNVKGPSGIDCFQVLDDSGATALLAAHGGHLLSWKMADGREQLFLSDLANFSSDKAIRGGVPIIFPQFSDHGAYSRHGFARRTLWEKASDENSLRLKSCAKTESEWPHRFELRLSLKLSANRLQIDFSVTNTDSSTFDFHSALHTYLRVSDVSSISVSGLEGCSFFDEANQLQSAPEVSPLSFGKEIDRAYHKAGDRIVKLTEGMDSLAVSSRGFPDTVVWNPGPEHGIGDLSKDGWKNFVCIEAALMEKYQTLAAGDTWRGSQILNAG